MKHSNGMRLFISLAVAVATVICSITVPVFATDAQISSYWTVTDVTNANSAKLSNFYAYDGSKSIHITHSSGDSAAMKLKPNWEAPALSIPYHGIIDNFLTFRAKGTLPQNGEIQMYSYPGNGVVLAYGNTTFTVGEADGNGWKTVSVYAQFTNTSNLTGGYLNICELWIIGDCDFYMDSIEYHVDKYNEWGVYDSSQAFFTNQDPSFETGDITEYDWSGYSYKNSDEIPQGHIAFSNGNWNTNGATSDNYITCSTKYAHSGTKSAHIVHTDGTNAEISLLPYFAEGEGESIKSSNFYEEDFWVSCDLSFYAKGQLPENGSFRISTTNGTLNIQINASSWEKGVPDANGWYRVTASGETSHYYEYGLFGDIDGHQGVTGFHITGDCNFYIDDISIITYSWNKGWELDTTINLLENRNPGFETVASTEYTLNYYPANAAGTDIQANAQKVNSFAGATATGTTNIAGRVTVPESVYGSTDVRMYLAIYKDGDLYYVLNKPVNSGTVTTGTQCFDLITSVPGNMSNGVYTSKLLVWRDSDYAALCQYAEITE